MTTKLKKPRDVDLIVGMNIRTRRQLVGMSQEKLADAIGVTFQQVQKYEKGTNRVGSSRLFEIATALNTTVTALFNGAEQGQAHPVAAQISELSAYRAAKMLDSISDSTARAAIIRVISAVAGDKKALSEIEAAAA